MGEWPDRPEGAGEELTKALVKRTLAGELIIIWYERHEVAGHNSDNSRNSKSSKTLKGEAGEMVIEVSRDRNGTFEPQLMRSTKPALKALTPRFC